MSDQNQTLLVHLLCVCIIALMIVLAFLTPLRSEPVAGAALIGLASWLYGKLTGKPIEPILNRIIEKMGPARVEEIMSQRPPAPPPPGAAP